MLLKAVAEGPYSVSTGQFPSRSSFEWKAVRASALRIGSVGDNTAIVGVLDAAVVRALARDVNSYRSERESMALCPPHIQLAKSRIIAVEAA